MAYKLEIKDENGGVIAKHEISKECVDLVLAAIHDAALKGHTPCSSASAKVLGVSSFSTAAAL